jgi:hypothetical protein
MYYLHQRKSSFLGETRMLTGIRGLAAQIIKQIDKEYDLDNE